MTENTYADRIAFIKEDQIMDIDFSDLTFDVSKPVNEFYDEVDRSIEKTGEKWFFLVNYRNCRIMNEAWITFAHRGKKSNLAYSLGTARYAASDETGGVILEKSKKERFDPNLFSSRDTALAHLRSLRSETPAEQFDTLIRLAKAPPTLSYDERVTFLSELEVMECDFSEVTFERSEHVHAFYDVIDRRLEETGRKWYFLVNYKNCTVLPEAWIAFASRGKKVNLAHSLGSVRFDASAETGQAIVDDSRKEKFDSNLFSSRDAALTRIAELRQAQS